VALPCALQVRLQDMRHPQQPVLGGRWTAPCWASRIQSQSQGVV